MFTAPGSDVWKPLASFVAVLNRSQSLKCLRWYEPMNCFKIDEQPFTSFTFRKPSHPADHCYDLCMVNIMCCIAFLRRESTPVLLERSLLRAPVPTQPSNVPLPGQVFGTNPLFVPCYAWFNGGRAFSTLATSGWKFRVQSGRQGALVAKWQSKRPQKTYHWLMLLPFCGAFRVTKRKGGRKIY